MSRDALLWQKAAKPYLSLLTSKNENQLTGIKLRRIVLHPEIIDLFKELDGSSILDLGCGNSWLSLELTERSENIVGIDISFPLLLGAKANGSSVIQGDVTLNFPFRSNLFDVIVANLLFQWIENISTCLAEANRVLKSKGILVITISHPYFSNKSGEWDKTDPMHPVFKLNSLRFHKRKAYIGLTLEERPIGPLNYYNRLISEYVNEFISAGFVIKSMKEVFCDEKIVLIQHDWVRHSHLPLFLMFVLQKE